MKKFLCSLMLLILVSMSLNQNVFAKEIPKNIDLTASIDIAINRLKSIQINDNNNIRKQIKLSDEVILDVSIITRDEYTNPKFKTGSFYLGIHPLENDIGGGGSIPKYKTVQSTFTLKHISGWYDLGELKAFGRFKLDGTPVNGSATHNSKLWNFTTSTSISGKFINCHFNGTYYYGIGPIGLNLQSLSKTCQLWYDGSGHYSWR